MSNISLQYVFKFSALRAGSNIQWQHSSEMNYGSVKYAILSVSSVVLYLRATTLHVCSQTANLLEHLSNFAFDTGH